MDNILRITYCYDEHTPSTFSYDVIWKNKESLDSWWDNFINRRGVGVPVFSSEGYEVVDPNDIAEKFGKGTWFWATRVHVGQVK